MNPTNNSSLTDLYDALKADNTVSKPFQPAPGIMRVGTINPGEPVGMNNPGAIAFKRKACSECDLLKNRCGKHILLDIYCKVLPLDQDYVNGHMGQMSSDIDCMLANKGCTPTQYLKSCSEKTKAPLLEFVNRSLDIIGNQFMEAENERLKKAQKDNGEVSEPEAPAPEDDPNVNQQLVDVKSDEEYDTFIDRLREKTINKIVKDVSKIINDKKEDANMTFDPKPIADQELQNESTTSVGINYIQQRCLQEGVQVPDDMLDTMVGMAVRESTLNELDLVFNQDGADLKNFASRIRYGHGSIINEHSVKEFIEAASNLE